MEELPQELVCLICSYLSPDDLANAYYVSNKFRDAAEDSAQKNRHCRLYCPDDESAMINNFRGFKHRYIDSIYFSVAPPPKIEPKGENDCCRVNREQQRERDELFTAQMQHLFATLKAMEDGAGARNRGSYQLVIHSPYEASVTGDCIHGDHPEWRTRLLRPEKLPDLISVRGLKFNDNEAGIKFDYRVFVDLIVRLPNASHLECHVGVNEWSPCYMGEPAVYFPWEYDGVRRDTRHEFSKALVSTGLLKSLQSVELDFFCQQSIRNADEVHQYKAQPNLTSPADKDPFSTSLRILSYNLRHLDLRAQVDESLFWPDDGSTPIWPCLESIRVMFHMVSPSGAWYFEGPQGEGRELTGYELDESAYPSDDESGDGCSSDERNRSFEEATNHWFRISPNEQVLVPFLTSFAKAALNMPKLRHAALWAHLRWKVDCDDMYYDIFDKYWNLPRNFYPDEMAWGFEYCVPGWVSVFCTKPRIVNRTSRQIRWNVGGWRPKRDLHSLFQQIGRQEHGDKLEERWIDEKYGKGLVAQYVFEPYDPHE